MNLIGADKLVLNEKKVITALVRHPELTKRELTIQCGVGWATAVKIIDRLIEKGFVEQGGTSKPAPLAGKNAYVYRISDSSPCAVGIDVEYFQTKIIFSDLKGRILAKEFCTTPFNPSSANLIEFICACYNTILAKNAISFSRVIGCGVGLPLWISHNHDIDFKKIGQQVSDRISLPVIVDNTVRNFALFHRWFGAAYGLSDFALVTIRNGVGSAVFANGELLTGTHGKAGEIGHIPVEQGGELCHCGKHGCLETRINQQILCRDYIVNELKEPLDPEYLGNQKIINQTLKKLFTSINLGNITAAQAIDESISVLAVGIASLVLLTDIPKLFIAGYFGPNGNSLIPILKKHLKKHLLPGMALEIDYLSLNDDDFTLGATLLVFQCFYTDLHK